MSATDTLAPVQISPVEDIVADMRARTTFATDRPTRMGRPVEGATIITAEPAAEAWTNQFADAANAALTAEGLNTTGDAFAPIEVTLNEGGN